MLFKRHDFSFFLLLRWLSSFGSVHVFIVNIIAVSCVDNRKFVEFIKSREARAHSNFRTSSSQLVSEMHTPHSTGCTWMPWRKVLSVWLTTVVRPTIPIWAKNENVRSQKFSSRRPFNVNSSVWLWPCITYRVISQIRNWPNNSIRQLAGADRKRKQLTACILPSIGWNRIGKLLAARAALKTAN